MCRRHIKPLCAAWRCTFSTWVHVLFFDVACVGCVLCSVHVNLHGKRVRWGVLCMNPTHNSRTNTCVAYYRIYVYALCLVYGLSTSNYVAHVCHCHSFPRTTHKSFDIGASVRESRMVELFFEMCFSFYHLRSHCVPCR